MRPFNFKKLWFKVERVSFDTGKDDIETVRKLLGEKRKGVIDLKKYKELKEERR